VPRSVPPAPFLHLREPDEPTDDANLRAEAGFVLEAVAAGPGQLRRTLDEYVRKSTAAAGHPRSFHALINKLRGPSVQGVPGVDGSTAWAAFQESAFAQINGFAFPRVVAREVPILADIAIDPRLVADLIAVEEGTTMIEVKNDIVRLEPLEPLVLEAYRLGFVELDKWVAAGMDASARGKRVEFFTPWFEPFAPRNETALISFDMVGKSFHSERSNDALRGLLAPSMSGRWSALPAQFGKVGVCPKNERGFFDWFESCVARLKRYEQAGDDERAGELALAGDPFIAYPSNKVRPDGAQFLERWASGGALAPARGRALPLRRTSTRWAPTSTWARRSSRRTRPTFATSTSAPRAGPPSRRGWRHGTRTLSLRWLASP
jgi:hypothetical protein